MPLLKYRCIECGKRFEELVSFSAAEEAKCPDCGGKAERAYEGKCLFGKPGASGCSGNCSGCSGCGHHG